MPIYNEIHIAIGGDHVDGMHQENRDDTSTGFSNHCKKGSTNHPGTKEYGIGIHAM